MGSTALGDGDMSEFRWSVECGHLVADPYRLICQHEGEWVAFCDLEQIADGTLEACLNACRKDDALRALGRRIAALRHLQRRCQQSPKWKDIRRSNRITGILDRLQQRYRRLSDAIHSTRMTKEPQ